MNYGNIGGNDGENDGHNPSDAAIFGNQVGATVRTLTGLGLDSDHVRVTQNMKIDEILARINHHKENGTLREFILDMTAATPEQKASIVEVGILRDKSGDAVYSDLVHAHILDISNFIETGEDEYDGDFRVLGEITKKEGFQVNFPLLKGITGNLTIDFVEKDDIQRLIDVGINDFVVSFPRLERLGSPGSEISLIYLDGTLTLPELDTLKEFIRFDGRGTVNLPKLPKEDSEQILIKRNAETEKLAEISIRLIF